MKFLNQWLKVSHTKLNFFSIILLGTTIFINKLNET